mmetsp:Transcript_9747/g.14495  ORF Transcript_9747/g.14495 Transcript_9747/m.14495 type:complete len:280 (-) Transcript_9747:866-1705(-)
MINRIVQLVLLAFLVLGWDTTTFGPKFVSSFIISTSSSNHHRHHYPTPSSSQSTTASRPTHTLRLYATNKNRKKKASNTPQPAQFEYQELRAQFTTMLNQKIRPKMLSIEKRNELETYLTKVLLNRPSPIQLKSLGDDSARVLYGQWTLVFSSEAATLGDLPRDATVQLIMKEDYKCDYKLTFEKTLGLKSITAKSTYMIDSSPLNPGLVTFIYQDITTDVFGFKNFPVGTFGLLKGRANYVESIWFDGVIWIERGYNPDGVEFFNVYLKDEDDDNWQK